MTTLSQGVAAHLQVHKVLEEFAVPDDYTLFVIPIPPSANQMHRLFGNRHHITKAYFDWLKTVAELIERADIAKRSEGQKTGIAIVIQGGKGFTKARDLDNVAKPILDALRPPTYARDGRISKPGAGILPDDNVQIVTSILLIYLEPRRRTDEAACWLAIYDTGPVKS